MRMRVVIMLILTLPLPSTIIKMNFISQCYFFCYRVLHYGIVQQCTRYKNILEGLQRFHGEISDLPTGNGQPNRGMQYLTLKLTTDSMLLSPEMLRDAVGFYIGTCISLLNNISNVSANTSNTSNNSINSGSAGADDWVGDWVATEAGMEPSHVELLKKLPEHLMEDIMVSSVVVCGVCVPGVCICICCDICICVSVRCIYFHLRLSV